MKKILESLANNLQIVLHVLERSACLLNFLPLKEEMHWIDGKIEFFLQFGGQSIRSLHYIKTNEKFYAILSLGWRFTMQITSWESFLFTSNLLQRKSCMYRFQNAFWLGGHTIIFYFYSVFGSRGEIQDERLDQRYKCKLCIDTTLPYYVSES